MLDAKDRPVISDFWRITIRGRHLNGDFRGRQANPADPGRLGECSRRRVLPEYSMDAPCRKHLRCAHPLVQIRHGEKVF